MARRTVYGNTVSIAAQGPTPNASPTAGFQDGVRACGELMAALAMSFLLVVVTPMSYGITRVVVSIAPVKVARNIVTSVAVAVTHFKAALRSVSVKRGADKMVNTEAARLAVFAKCHSDVCATPARSQDLTGNALHESVWMATRWRPFNKGVQPSHATEIANLIKSFVSPNGTPRFHGVS